MYPIHDLDVLVLMATALSSKRRPALLAEIVAAADLIQGSIPPEGRLAESFRRLGGFGLLAAVDGEDGGFTLTPDGEAIVSGLPKKASTVERFSGIRDQLIDYHPKGTHPPIDITPEEVAAAIQAHRSAAQAKGRNLLVPKAKVAEGSNKRYDQRRKFGTPRRNKD